MNIKKIAIIGAGALGVMYGSYLTKAFGKKQVAFLCDEIRVKRNQESVYTANEEKCDFNFSTPEEFGIADFVIFAVKYTAFSDAISLAKKVSGPETIYLSVLNGIASERDLEPLFMHDQIIYCVAQEMDAMKSGTNVTWTKMGVLVIGSKENTNTPQLQAVKACFETAGINYRIPIDIHHALWSKLMLNTGINQCCAYFDATYEEVLNTKEMYETFYGAMKEVQMLAAYESIHITDEEVDTWVKVIASLKPSGYPSMRQDTLAKRKTEVELFAGTMCRLAMLHQVEVPINTKLYNGIKYIESNY